MYVHLGDILVLQRIIVGQKNPEEKLDYFL
jgi:hypothetical protein